jgi:hypothetical protein
MAYAKVVFPLSGIRSIVEVSNKSSKGTVKHMIVGAEMTAPNTWIVSGAPCGGNAKMKPLAEAKLIDGKYVQKPLKKLTKSEAMTVDGYLLYRLLESYGDPKRGSIEARLEKLNDKLSDFANHFEGLDVFPELVEKLDAAGDLLLAVCQALREARGHGEPEWEAA